MLEKGYKQKKNTWGLLVKKCSRELQKCILFSKEMEQKANTMAAFTQLQINLKMVCNNKKGRKAVCKYREIRIVHKQSKRSLKQEMVTNSKH